MIDLIIIIGVLTIMFAFAYFVGKCMKAVNRK